VTTLLLARHGETDWNRDHRWQGFTGPPLNETGRRQARELGARLDVDIDAIYSSDSERARETAEIVAARLGLSVTEDPRLREMNLGEWEGLTRHEIDERYANGFSRWDACELPQAPGGESDAAMADRVLEAFTEIAGRHGGQRVLVVTSGGPIRALQAHVGGIDQARSRRHFERTANCALVRCEIRDGSFELGDVSVR
jgi:2,3-bisphosphoglycerate-dependent phosphoglycerate mutase